MFRQPVFTGGGHLELASRFRYVLLELIFVVDYNSGTLPQWGGGRLELASRLCYVLQRAYFAVVIGDYRGFVV